MAKTYTIAVLSGDGIGPEIMKQALKVLDAIARKHSLSFIYKEGDVGGMAIDKHGTALPKETLEICENCDAILFGAVGDPKYDDLPPEKKIEHVSLLFLRKHFNLYANLRPATCYKSLTHASPLRPDIVKDGFDMLVIRELNGGIYFGKHELHEDWASDELKYTKPEVERIAKTAFEMAMKRKKKLTCVDKSNVLSSSVFWRKIVNEVAKQYPEVELDYLYIDNATMAILKRPHDYDVIVTTNMFGDILSDEAAQVAGSIGMLGSASINDENFGMYEPAGGSAPKYAGKDIVNPIAQVLSAAMMLKYSFGLNDAATDIENAVQTVLEQNIRTKDIAQADSTIVGTEEMGTKIAAAIK